MVLEVCCNCLKKLLLSDGGKEADSIFYLRFVFRLLRVFSLRIADVRSCWMCKSKKEAKLLRVPTRDKFN